MLAYLLRMTALEAAETGIKHSDGNLQDLLVGAWDWDVVNDRLYADARFADMFGIEPKEAAAGTPQRLWLSAIHPDDRRTLEAAISEALNGMPFAIEYQW